MKGALSGIFTWVIAKKLWAAILILSFVFPLPELYAQGMMARQRVSEIAVEEDMPVVDFKSLDGEIEFNSFYNQSRASFADEKNRLDYVFLSNFIKKGSSLFIKNEGKAVSIPSVMPCRSPSEYQLTAEYCSIDGVSPPYFKTLTSSQGSKNVGLRTIDNYFKLLGLLEEVSHRYKWIVNFSNAPFDVEPATEVLYDGFIAGSDYRIEYPEEDGERTLNINDLNTCMKKPETCARSPLSNSVSADLSRINIPVIQTLDEKINKDINKKVFDILAKENSSSDVAYLLVANAMEEDVLLANQLQLAENYIYLESQYGSGIPDLNIISSIFCPIEGRYEVTTYGGLDGKTPQLEQRTIKFNDHAIQKCRKLIEELYLKAYYSKDRPQRPKNHEEIKEELKQITIEINKLRLSFAEKHRELFISVLQNTDRYNEGLDKNAHPFTQEERQTALKSALKESDLDTMYQSALSELANKYPLSRYLLANDETAELYFGDPKFPEDTALGFPYLHEKGFKILDNQAGPGGIRVRVDSNTKGLSNDVTFGLIDYLDESDKAFKYFDFDTKHKALKFLIFKRGKELFEKYSVLMNEYLNYRYWASSKGEDLVDYYNGSIQNIGKLVYENPVAASSIFLISAHKAHSYIHLVPDINKELKKIRFNEKKIEKTLSALKVISAVAGVLWVVGGVVGWCLKGVSAGATIAFSAIRVTNFFTTLIFAAAPPILTGLSIYQKGEVASQKERALVDPELNTLLINNLTEKERSLIKEIYVEAFFSLLSIPIASQLAKEIHALKNVSKNKDLFKAYLYTGHDLGKIIKNNPDYLKKIKALTETMKEGEIDRLIIYLNNAAGEKETLEILSNTDELARVIKTVKKNYPNILSEPISPKNLNNFKKLYNAEIYSMGTVKNASIFGGSVDQIIRNTSLPDAAKEALIYDGISPVAKHYKYLEFISDAVNSMDPKKINAVDNFFKELNSMGLSDEMLQNNALFERVMMYFNKAHMRQEAAPDRRKLRALAEAKKELEFFLFTQGRKLNDKELNRIFRPLTREGVLGSEQELEELAEVYFGDKNMFKKFEEELSWGDIKKLRDSDKDKDGLSISELKNELDEVKKGLVKDIDKASDEEKIILRTKIAKIDDNILTVENFNLISDDFRTYLESGLNKNLILSSNGKIILISEIKKTDLIEIDKLVAKILPRIRENPSGITNNLLIDDLIDHYFSKLSPSSSTNYLGNLKTLKFRAENPIELNNIKEIRASNKEMTTLGKANVDDWSFFINDRTHTKTVKIQDQNLNKLTLTQTRTSTPYDQMSILEINIDAVEQRSAVANTSILVSSKGEDIYQITAGGSKFNNQFFFVDQFRVGSKIIDRNALVPAGETPNFVGNFWGLSVVDASGVKHEFILGHTHLNNVFSSGDTRRIMFLYNKAKDHVIIDRLVSKETLSGVPNYWTYFQKNKLRLEAIAKKEVNTLIFQLK